MGSPPGAAPTRCVTVGRFTAFSGPHSPLAPPSGEEHACECGSSKAQSAPITGHRERADPKC